MMRRGRRLRALAVAFVAFCAGAGLTPFVCHLRIVDLKVDRVRYGHLPFLSDALFGYRFDFGEFPTAEQGLHALVEPPGGRESYLRKELPRDPWGRDYVYRPTAGGQGFSLYSAGANQIDEHGAGDDIVNGPKNIRVRSMASASFDRACGPKPGRGSELS